MYITRIMRVIRSREHGPVRQAGAVMYIMMKSNLVEGAATMAVLQ